MFAAVWGEGEGMLRPQGRDTGQDAVIACQGGILVLKEDFPRAEFQNLRSHSAYLCHLRLAQKANLGVNRPGSGYDAVHLGRGEPMACS